MMQMMFHYQEYISKYAESISYFKLFIKNQTVEQSILLKNILKKKSVKFRCNFN